MAHETAFVPWSEYQALAGDVAQLRSALGAALEDIAALRRDGDLENAKLQREFRESLDTVLLLHDPDRPAAPPQGTTIHERLEALEATVAGRGEPEAHAAPYAVQAALGSVADYLRHADDEFAALRRSVEDKVAVLAAPEPKPERPDVTAAQVSNMVNAQVVEVAALVDTELAKVRDAVAQQKSESDAVEHRLAAVAETVAQLDAEAQQSQAEVSATIQALRTNGAAAEDYVKRLERFVEEFTTNESANVRDEVLRLLNTDAAIAQRRTEERQRRDDLAALRADVAHCVATSERAQEEVTKVGQQHHTMFQAVRRLEAVADDQRKAMEATQRDELDRIAQQQKAFFQRHEAALALDRQQHLAKIEDDLRRGREQQLDVIRSHIQKRLDDLLADQRTLRDDMSSLQEKLQDDIQRAVATMRDSFDAATARAQEQFQREAGGAVLEAKRQRQQQQDELRKSTARLGDDMRRVHGAVEETLRSVREEQQHLKTRVEQLVADEQSRSARMADDVALRLGSVVEEEVKRVTSLSEGTTQRAIQQLDERQGRDVKALRDEAASQRQALAVASLPSGALQTLDTRLDVLRRDVTELGETVAAVRVDGGQRAAGEKTEVQRQMAQLERAVLELRVATSRNAEDVTAMAKRTTARPAAALADDRGPFAAHTAFPQSPAYPGQAAVGRSGSATGSATPGFVIPSRRPAPDALDGLDFS